MLCLSTRHALFECVRMDTDTLYSDEQYDPTGELLSLQGK